MTDSARDDHPLGDADDRMVTPEERAQAEAVEDDETRTMRRVPAVESRTSDPLNDPFEPADDAAEAEFVSPASPGDESAPGWPQAASITDSTPLPAPPPSARPSGPPPSGPPPSGPPPMPPSGPLTGPLTGPPSGPPSMPPAGPPASGPLSTPPSAPPSMPPSSHPSVPDQPSAQPGADPGVRRFMSATDFLDRRENEQAAGPATWGWRGRVRRWSGGLLKPAMGAAEQAHHHDRLQIQRDFEGPRTIAFINPKGGAAKTTGVLAAGHTFGTVRGGGVVAWDNNETRGTLGIRGARGSHRNTTRELLNDLSRFKDVRQARLGDLGSYVRSQGDAHFDVLASDERPDVTGTIRASDFNELHQVLGRFYRILLVDSGNNMRAENWLAAVDAADLLVVTSTVREDTGYSGLWMLDALQDAGMQNLKYRCVTVLSDPSPKVDPKLAADLVSVYEQRTRAVFRVPYDPALVAGSVVPYNSLSPDTRASWLKACAGMAAAL